MNVKATKKKNQVVTANIFEQQELLKKAEVIRENLTASTWRELETNGKFDKNEKLSFISDDMLILGCDVGSETHYMRAIDTRGRELSKSVYSFNNDTAILLSWDIPISRCVWSNSGVLSRLRQCGESSSRMRRNCQESFAWVRNEIS